MHGGTHSHTLTILGRGPDPQCPRYALDRVYKSALYTLHTHTLRVSALSVCVCVCVIACVCVCSQASRSRATLSCDSSYFTYWQCTIQASYAVIRQLLFSDLGKQYKLPTPLKRHMSGLALQGLIVSRVPLKSGF